MTRNAALQLGLMLGDGIGPEIVPAATAVVDAALVGGGGRPVDWVLLPVGADAIVSHGTAIPDETIQALASLPGWMLGPHDCVSYPEPFRSQLNPSGTIRRHFDLFANIRPAKAYAGARSIVPDTDLVIVRENSEGFYADRNTHKGSGEFMPSPDVAIAMGIITRAGTERIAHEAFQIAQQRRGEVAIVHKANVLKLTTGLFRDVSLQVAAQYPKVRVRTMHIDAMAAQLVRNADLFDVILTENMMGDILSDLAGEVAGSLGIAASINYSAQHVMAQASHGAAPDIAGHDTANPVAMMLSAAMMLDRLSERLQDTELTVAADRIRAAVEQTITAGISTVDLGGSASTSGFTAAVLDQIGVHQGVA
jgi:3-isopropylmalate dehydrogenase